MPLSKTFPQAVRRWWWSIRGWDPRTWAVCLFENFWNGVNLATPKWQREGRMMTKILGSLAEGQSGLVWCPCPDKNTVYLCDYVFKWRLLQTWEQRVPLWIPHKCLQSRNVTRHDLSQLQWQLRFPSWPSAAPQDFDRRKIPGGSSASQLPKWSTEGFVWSLLVVSSSGFLSYNLCPCRSLVLRKKASSVGVASSSSPQEQSGRDQPNVGQEEMLLIQSCKERGATALAGILWLQKCKTKLFGEKTSHK